MLSVRGSVRPPGQVPTLPPFSEGQTRLRAPSASCTATQLISEKGS